MVNQLRKQNSTKYIKKDTYLLTRRKKNKLQINFDPWKRKQFIVMPIHPIISREDNFIILLHRHNFKLKGVQMFHYNWQLSEFSNKIVRTISPVKGSKGQWNCKKGERV